MTVQARVGFMEKTSITDFEVELADKLFAGNKLRRSIPKMRVLADQNLIMVSVSGYAAINSVRGGLWVLGRIFGDGN